jgi:MFS family permease
VFGLSPNVFFMGLVSFFTDVSSEMTLTVLPLFLANVLGVKTSIIGLIEGIAESTATLLKIFSGWFSDRLGKRKGLTVLGYGLSAFTKPLLYFANNWPLVLVIRFADRVGKGLRTAPRDALVADSAGGSNLGRSFGFHRAMDTGGATLGVALAAAIIYLSQKSGLNLIRSTYQHLVLVAMIPAFLAVAILGQFVQEVKRPVITSAAVPSFSLEGLGPRFRIFLAIVVIFTLGNSSDAFLILRAQNLGLSVLEIFVMLTMFNLLYALVSWPAGALSDRVGRRTLIVMGWSVYGLVYLGFAAASTAWQVWALYVIYGIYYGFFEGVGKALVADVVPWTEQRGTAYGLYNGAVGLTTLPASFIAGVLWQAVGPAAPFVFGAGLALLAAVLLAVWLG